MHQLFFLKHLLGLWLTHSRFTAALGRLKRRLSGSATANGNSKSNRGRRCAPRRIGGIIPPPGSDTPSRNNNGANMALSHS